MASTREKIVETAKKIFSENEYDKVSLRDIASACNISPGNLNYHFSKKEDLVMTCMEDVYNDVFQDFALSTDETLEKLLNHLLMLDETAKKYDFYFKNMLTLSSTFETAKDRQIKVREQMYFYYMRSFNMLKKHGIFRMDVPVNVYNNLARNLLLTQVIWHLHNSPTGDEIFSKISFFNSLCDCIYPYLTEVGKKMWNTYFENN